jgi:hypothetical protein
LRRQATQFSRPLRRRLPLHRAIDAASLGATTFSLNTTPSLSPSPSPTPSLGDPAFGLDAAGGVPIVIPNPIIVAIPDPIAPSPTSSLTPSLHTACTRCVIVLPSQPPPALIVPCRMAQRCIDATVWGPVGQMWTCALGGGPRGCKHGAPSCQGLSPPPPLFLTLWRVGRASSSPPVHDCKLVCHCYEK